MKLLEHLNLYFGYEAKSMKEFISDFKQEHEGYDEDGIQSLLMFLNSYSKVSE